MNNNGKHRERHHSGECPECGSGPLGLRIEEERFRYGSGEEAVELVATVPVRVCEACGFKFYPPEAEDAKHVALLKHLGRRMTPKDVLDLREKRHLTRSQFADFSKLGEATLGRWERGEFVQSAANDQYLFLLTFDDNIERLQTVDGTPPRHKPATPLRISFPDLDQPDKVASDAAAFSLRPHRDTRTAKCL